MKKHILYLSILVVLCLLVYLSFFGDISPAKESVDIKDIVISHVDLINRIIKNPKEANMKNWTQLRNSHDETELNFYMNSISDGSLTNYRKNTLTMKNLIKHSRSVTEAELSTVLQYLRLSLMSYNIKPGSEPPSFKLKYFENKNDNNMIAYCDFSFYNASGKKMNKNAKILFGIGDNQGRDLYLEKIFIDSHNIYGWWY